LVPLSIFGFNGTGMKGVFVTARSS